MASRFEYIPDPAMWDTPIELDELEAVIVSKGKGLKDQRALAHLLHRVKVTIAGMRKEATRLHHQVSQIAAESQVTGVASTLDPRTAVQFMSPDELAELVEGNLRAQVRNLRKVVADAEAARRDAQQLHSRIKYAVARLNDDPEIPDSTKARLAQLISEMPDIPAHPDPVIEQLSETVGAGLEADTPIDDLGELFG